MITITVTKSPAGFQPYRLEISRDEKNESTSIYRYFGYKDIAISIGKEYARTSSTRLIVKV